MLFHNWMISFHVERDERIGDQMIQVYPSQAHLDRIGDGFLLRKEEYTQDPMNISRILSQRRLEWAQVLCNTTLNGATFSIKKLPLNRGVLVTQGIILAGFDVRKLSWMKELNEVACLGHVAIELEFDRPYLN